MSGSDFETLKNQWAGPASGQTADDFALLAAQAGADTLTIIRLLKDLYGLSVVKAQSAAVFAQHGSKYGRPSRDLS